jgi:NitT/TauT family transport system substrate-binding protein
MGIFTSSSRTATKKYKRNLAAVAAASAFLLATTGCAQSAGPAGSTDSASSDGDSAEIQQITVTLPFGDGSPAAIPVWMGENLGYFEEEGIDVEVVQLAGRPAETVGLVVAGQADLVVSAAESLIVPAASGKDQGLSWVFTPYQGPTFRIAVPAESNIQSAKDLEGKTVGMASLGAPFETFARANIEADGGDGTNMEAVVVAGAGAIESMNKEDVDAFVDNVSTVDLASLSTGVEVRKLDFPGTVGQNLAAGIMIRQDATEEEKETYAKFLRAYIKSAIFAQENPEAAIEMNWEKYPASKKSELSDEENMEQAKTVLLSTVNEFKPGENGQWGHLEPERWDAHLEYLGLAGKIEDLSTLYDNSLLETINDFDEDAVRDQAKNFEG